MPGTSSQSLIVAVYQSMDLRAQTFRAAHISVS